jgi:CHAT domain-containing protein
MKAALLSLLLCAPVLVAAQIDTAAIEKQVDSLYQAGLQLGLSGKFDEGIPLALQAKELCEAQLGREDLRYAQSLTLLGRFYNAKNEFAKAEMVFIEAIAIWEKIKQVENPDYVTAHIKLGLNYEKTGRYREAEYFLLKGKGLAELIFGKDNTQYIEAVQDLGVFYYYSGRLPEAEPYMREARDIRAKMQGKDNVQYAGTTTNLANLNSQIGHYNIAEALYLESKNIFEKIGATRHEFYRITLMGLGGMYATMGSYDASEKTLLELKAFFEATNSNQGELYGTYLHKLGTLYLNAHRYADAERFLLEAKETLDAKGIRNISYMNNLHHLGDLYLQIGKPAQAEETLLDAKSVVEEIVGKEHPIYNSSDHLLYHLYFDQKRKDEATALFEKHQKLEQKLISKGISFFSEEELASFQKSNSRICGYSIASKYPYPEVLEVCYDNILFNKGFLLNAVLKIRNAALADSTTAPIYEELSYLKRQLSQEYAKPVIERKNLIEMEAQADIKEREIARNISAFALENRQVKWQEVQSSLRTDEAAIEFINFTHSKRVFSEATNSSLYVVLILRSGFEAPHWVLLFEEKSLDSLLQLHGERRSDYVNDLYAFAERGARPLGKPQKSLYELIWQPLEKELEGVQTIYFSPSGLLHRLNLGAIPISGEQTLADRYRLVGLGSTRQLVIPSEVKVASQDALVFGGVQYEMDSTAIAAANVDFGTDLFASRGGLSFSYADSTHRGGTWNYLKWTEREVTSLEPILKSSGIQPTIRKGYTTTEESFKSIGKGKPSPRILHIATHGFFFPDPKSEVRGERVRGEMEEPVFKISDHPMIRSGLILAGGNHAWKTGKPLRPDMEDGILTAYEISQMNLSNTELVVLSACETGLGDIEGNEGVYGLQRAFKIAGAKYLIMSLWQVPDYQTQELMTSFYKNWLEGKMSIPDAFRSAQGEMREKYQSPYFWAGFVLVE